MKEVLSKRIRDEKWHLILFCYHLFFIFFAYQVRVLKGFSDAHFYWALNFDINKYTWSHFVDYGTNFILFLNYPFIKLGLPFCFGFVMYGIIGFLGILKWMQWAELVTGEKIYIKGINVLYLFFFLPNLHVWTANLGKEAIIFWCLATVFYAMASHNFKSVHFVLATLLLIIIRPHVALMLLMAIAAVVFFASKLSLKIRFFIVVAFCLVMSLLFYMVLQLTKIEYLDWDRIKYFNDYSILSFKHSGTYVDMLHYNYFYRIFTLNFMPLFVDIHTAIGFFASVENGIVLLMFITGLCFFIRYYKKIEIASWMKIAVLFMVIASLLYIQRYANLGIFMRTKIMYMPFVLIALFCIIKQGFALSKSKT